MAEWLVICRNRLAAVEAQEVPFELLALSHLMLLLRHFSLVRALLH